MTEVSSGDIKCAVRLWVSYIAYSRSQHSDNSLYNTYVCNTDKKLWLRMWFSRKYLIDGQWYNNNKIQNCTQFFFKMFLVILV